MITTLVLLAKEAKELNMSKAVVVGSGGGAAVGFFLGGPLGALIGAGIGALGGKRYSVTHGMTPERKKIFEEALKTLKDPEKLRKLADEFRKQGLEQEADLLFKRANLRELPAEQKAARRDSMRKAFTVGSKENPATPEKIEALGKFATVLHEQGATANAAAIRKHVEGLKKLLKSK